MFNPHQTQCAYALQVSTIFSKVLAVATMLSCGGPVLLARRDGLAAQIEKQQAVLAENGVGGWSYSRDRPRRKLALFCVFNGGKKKGEVVVGSCAQLHVARAVSILRAGGRTLFRSAGPLCTFAVSLED